MNRFSQEYRKQFWPTFCTFGPNLFFACKCTASQISSEMNHGAAMQPQNFTEVDFVTQKFFVILRSILRHLQRFSKIEKNLWKTECQGASSNLSVCFCLYCLETKHDLCAV